MSYYSVENVLIKVAMSVVTDNIINFSQLRGNDLWFCFRAQQLEQMGVARVALDPHRPLIPRHRLVHLDLKGAPPRISYLKKLLPIFKRLGATGLLLEWEDMFPFSGSLAKVAATNHYTPDEVGLSFFAVHQIFAPITSLDISECYLLVT
jgi:hypothetical protein